MFIDVKFRDEFLFLFFSFFICCSFTGMPFVWLENENIRNNLCRHEPRYSRLANWEGIKKVGFLSMAKSSSVLKECVYLIANIIYKLRNVYICYWFLHAAWASYLFVCYHRTCILFPHIAREDFGFFLWASIIVRTEVIC